MDSATRRSRLQGCYVTIPTMFRDDDELSVDLDAIARHVEFLIDGGCVTGDAVLLAGGAAGDFSTMTFEGVVSRFGSRFSIIDNQMRYVTSHILGARSIEVHVANYWPQWGVALWRMLERGEYAEAQREMVRVAMPFMNLWMEMESFTSGDGYLDKLCMELVGLDSSRSRPPTRDVRPRYREQARQMLVDCGVPGVLTPA